VKAEIPPPPPPPSPRAHADPAADNSTDPHVGTRRLQHRPTTTRLANHTIHATTSTKGKEREGQEPPLPPPTSSTAVRRHPRRGHHQQNPGRHHHFHHPKVLHTTPTKYKPGEMRRWVEEDNRGIQILGIRWLIQEHRRAGKLASSLVIYMKEKINLNHGLRMGRRIFRTTEYDWKR